MVKFYYDRCGSEVEGLDALLEFSVAPPQTTDESKKRGVRKATS
jgi:hypothetical protein